ncbi:MAG TPA: SRPBCC domain-containing protein, partial [Arthrobacter sp.]|nr:SRPBCC domain-containing protein [Arthrobacter sp.]
EVRPDGGSLVIISTYDLGASKVESIRASWDGWRAENYPTSETVH